MFCVVVSVVGGADEPPSSTTCKEMYEVCMQSKQAQVRQTLVFCGGWWRFDSTP